MPQQDEKLAETGQQAVDRAQEALSVAQWRGWAARNLTLDGGSIQDGFRVDPGRLREAVRKIDGVLRDLSDTIADTQALQIEPPGYDDISMNIARNANLMRDNALAYILAWHQQVQDTRDALAQSLAAYEATEAANTARRA